MSFAQIVLVVYALLMAAGGVFGWRKAGSKASLYSGAGSGVLLIGAWILSMSDLATGLWLGAIVTLLLCYTFAARIANTGKFMPPGMLLILSVVVLIIVSYHALDAQGKFESDSVVHEPKIGGMPAPKSSALTKPPQP